VLPYKSLMTLMVSSTSAIFTKKPKPRLPPKRRGFSF
jgi:hypothetical protein